MTGSLSGEVMPMQWIDATFTGSHGKLARFQLLGNAEAVSRNNSSSIFFQCFRMFKVLFPTVNPTASL